MAKTVLIVEDNELNMKLFNDLLEANGYTVIQTRDGLSAIDLARKHRPDLILMDIQLPEVSGIEVTKWLKEDDELRRIPVIAVTAFAMKGDEQKIREGGCEAYISKPISVVNLVICSPSTAMGVMNSLIFSLTPSSSTNWAISLPNFLSVAPWLPRILRPSRSSAWMPFVPS